MSSLNKGLGKKTLKNVTIETLQELERNGGNEAYKQIKQKIPTYTTIL